MYEQMFTYVHNTLMIIPTEQISSKTVPVMRKAFLIFNIMQTFRSTSVLNKQRPV